MRCRFLTWVLALLLIGGHVAGLQVVAWVGMLAARAPEQGFVRAAESTFDGDHPCSLCLAVSAFHRMDQAAPGDPDKTGSLPGKAPKPADKQVGSVDLLPPEALAGIQASSGFEWMVFPVVPSLAAQDRPCPEPPPPKAG